MKKRETLASVTLDKVISEVINETLNEYKAALEKARQEAYSILEHSAQEASRKAAEIEEDGRRKRESLRQRIISLAEINSRNKSIEVLESGINLVVQEAMKRIETITNKKELGEILRNLLNEAIEVIQVKEIIIQTNRESYNVLQNIAGDIERSSGVKITVDDTPIQTICGIKVRSVDGRIIYDNTVETRIERVRQVIRKELASLFME